MSFNVVSAKICKQVQQKSWPRDVMTGTGHWLSSTWAETTLVIRVSEAQKLRRSKAELQRDFLPWLCSAKAEEFLAILDVAVRPKPAALASVREKMLSHAVTRFWQMQQLISVASSEVLRVLDLSGNSITRSAEGSLECTQLNCNLLVQANGRSIDVCLSPEYHGWELVW